ncbi:MAG: hypothetical protein N2258_02290 [Brevinematales bacterium]|nr:hypothetical protein [Brevinematales bacterium]
MREKKKNYKEDALRYQKAKKKEWKKACCYEAIILIFKWIFI